MRSTANSKTATAQATGILLLIAGFAATIYSAHRNEVAGSIAGACLVISALTWVSLIRIRRWTTDTSNERRTLADATRAADDERNRYVAAQAAAAIEYSRRQQDLAAERASVEARLVAERAKMRQDFEGERTKIMTDAFRTGVEMERAGMLKPDAPQLGNLIQFPKDLPLQQQERSREHGATRP